MSRRLQVARAPELWVPRAEIKLHNKFHLELFKAKNGKKLTEAWAENVVTNSGRTQCADNGCFEPWDIMGACAIGTGTNAPAPTDTTMGANAKSYAGVALSTQISNPMDYSIAIGDWWRRHKFYFPETVGNYSLTEVGLFRGSTSSSGGYGPGQSGNATNFLSAASNPLMTRALFRDANGDPISVTKSNTQIMVITATVYLTRGGVDSGMRLLDNFFARNVDAIGNTSYQYHRNGQYMYWFLGNGSSAPNNNDTTLGGVQQALKNGQSVNGKNYFFWTSLGWITAFGQSNNRPAEKPYTSTFSQEWDLNEANVTFSEVLVRMQQASQSNLGAPYSAIHIVFPCGTVSGTSVTKNNTQKLRQYVELAW